MPLKTSWGRINNAMVFAWDTFCTLYPNHIQKRRPFGRIRPANFDEAWIICEALKDGLAELPYCTTCHTPYLVIHGCKYQQVCQMCVLNQIPKSRERSTSNRSWGQSLRNLGNEAQASEG